MGALKKIPYPAKLNMDLGYCMVVMGALKPRRRVNNKKCHCGHNTLKKLVFGAVLVITIPMYILDSVFFG